MYGGSICMLPNNSVYPCDDACGLPENLLAWFIPITVAELIGIKTSVLIGYITCTEKVILKNHECGPCY